MAFESIDNGVEHVPAVDLARVAGLDPLGLDPVMNHLPGLNRDADEGMLLAATQRAVDEIRYRDEMSSEEACASLRDVSMLAMSLQRHGVEPMSSIAGLDTAMLRLGDIVGTVPIMTVASYAAGNPRGGRERTFTGSDAERAFIEDLRSSYVPLEIAAATLGDVQLPDRGTTRQLDQALQDAEAATAAMVASIYNSRKRIPFEAFTNDIRPYFEPIVMQGRVLHAANGAQLPLAVLEPMLFGHGDPVRDRFLRENIPYLTAMQRAQLRHFEYVNDGRSVATCSDTQVQERLRHINQNLYVFRGRHLVVAQGNFALRGAGAMGSGSFGMDDVAAVFHESAARRQTL